MYRILHRKLQKFNEINSKQMEIFCAHWLDESILLRTVKISILPNLIQIKIPASYFVHIDKSDHKVSRGEKTQNNQHKTEEQDWRTDSIQFQDLA